MRIKKWRLSRRQKWLLALSVVVLAVIPLLVGLWPYKRAIWVENSSWQKLNDTILPFIKVRTPVGSGPFPVVLVFPGCEGVRPERAKPRMDWLVQAGYMAVMVDSHSGRGLDEDTVCNGYALWGSERAADLYAALAFVRSHPLADSNRVALLGYSHGGWTILDALSYNGKPPRGLDSVPDNLMTMVKAAVVYYPYCGFPSRARYLFSATVPLLAIHAGGDTRVDSKACVRMMASWQAQGLPVTSQIYPFVDHAFDVEGHRNFDEPAHRLALKQLKDFLAFFLTRP